MGNPSNQTRHKRGHPRQHSSGSRHLLRHRNTVDHPRRGSNKILNPAPRDPVQQQRTRLRRTPRSPNTRTRPQRTQHRNRTRRPVHIRHSHTAPLRHHRAQTRRHHHRTRHRLKRKIRNRMGARISNPGQRTRRTQRPSDGRSPDRVRRQGRTHSNSSIHQRSCPRLANTRPRVGMRGVT